MDGIFYLDINKYR